MSRLAAILAMPALLWGCGSSEDEVRPQRALQGGGGSRSGASGGDGSGHSDRGGADNSGGSGASEAAGAAGQAEGSSGSSSVVDPPGSWRSALYPKGWLPLDDGGKADAERRFLHDYSYAGYHLGMNRPPYGVHTPKATVDASVGNGTTNATSAIQAAIDSVCAQGGGIVRIPEGLYRVRLPSDSAAEAIRIACSHLVLRGDGPGKTRILFDDPTRARAHAVIAIRPGTGSIFEGNASALATDVAEPTRELRLQSTEHLAQGDMIVVRNDNTADFRAEHRMNAANTGEGDFWAAGSFRGILYPRRVLAVTGNEIEIDAPTRYALKRRDNARIDKLDAFLEESGVESLAIGMVQNNTSSLANESSRDEEYKVSGTTAYQVHDSRAVYLEMLHDGWLYDVDTFIPEANSGSRIHILSNGIQLAPSTFRITVEKCDFGRPQYRGGGGNGYLIHIQGNDNLFIDNTTSNARHGFIFNQAVSGNVFLRGVIHDSRLSDDSHRFLAHANLYDGVTLDKAWLQAVNRGSTSSGGGFTATAHVFWRTHVLANHNSARGCAVETAQFALGYAIGSSAAEGAQARLCPDSFSNSYWAGLDSGAPEDFVEGEDKGETLFPPSLYLDQLANRCARQGLTCR